MPSSNPQARLPTLVGAAVGALAALTLRAVTADPLTTLHRLCALDVLPPLWLMSALWLAWAALLGGAMAHALVRAGQGGAATAAWRGSTCLCLSAMTAAAWYALLFGKGALLLSWLCLLASALAAALAALSWAKCASVPAILTAAFALWSILLFFLQLAVMLHN